MKPDYKRSEVPVLSVEATGEIVDLGAAAAKTMPLGKRHRYTRGIVHVLKDGRRIESEVGALTKPKLAERIEHTRQYASNGELSMIFHDDRHVGTSIKFKVGS